MDQQAPDASAHFVGKWLHREPEMVFAEVFCPNDDKLAFRAWGALLHELRESLFELSDPSVARIKTAWWAEEMIGLGQGRQRFKNRDGGLTGCCALVPFIRCLFSKGMFCTGYLGRRAV